MVVSRDSWQRVLPCALVVALSAVANPAFAQTVSSAAPSQGDPQQIRQELDRLRQEFEAIRDSYGARLAALEAKLAPTPAGAAVPAEAPAAVTSPPPVSPPAATPQAAVLPADAPPQMPASNAAALSKVFNPDMAVIGNFLGAAGENQVRPTPALQMNEAEVTFQAVVDPYARGDFFLSFTPDGVEIEEGFITLTSLPGGLLTKVGKMKEQFGKVNTLHPHALPWADRPLVMANLLGGDEGMSDSGVSVSKLLLNPLFFLEATGESVRGDGRPVRIARAKRSQLGRAPARIPGSDRGDEPGHWHLVRLRAQRQSDRTTRRGCSVSMRPSATGRYSAPSTGGSSRGRR